jgi:phosphoglycerate dehydrogenase-like enzyme
MKKYKIAVLDDYQNVALKCADWSGLSGRAEVTVFEDHLSDPKAVIERLLPFEIVCVMRERTPLPRNVIERLPHLKLIASTGTMSASIDVTAAGDHGVAVIHTGYSSDPTIEFTWALILASARHIVTESNSVRSGGWQQTVGTDLHGKTLGVLGLGRIGSQVARIGSAFGMNLIAWSQNMTTEAAKAASAILVSKDQLFEQADILTIHLVLSSRTRRLVGAAELQRMKPTARLINASRGPIVDERALIEVLKNKQIAGAAIDVFDVEPLSPSHPFRTLDNVLATPHIGYVRKVFTRRSTRIPSRIFGSGSKPIRRRQGWELSSIQSLRTTFMKSSAFRFMDALLTFKCCSMLMPVKKVRIISVSTMGFIRGFSASTFLAIRSLIKARLFETISCAAGGSTAN